MPRLRSPSLFWTFAGSFLVVLVAAAALQGVVLVAVVEPIAARWAEDRASLLAGQAAREIGAVGAAASESEIRDILRRIGGEDRKWVLLFRDPEGHVVPDRPMPPMMARRLLAVATGGEDSPGADVGPPDRKRDRGGDRGRGRFGSRGPPPMRLVRGQPVETSSGVVGEVLALVPVRRFTLWPETAPRPVLLALPIAVILAGAAGLIMFRILIRRLRDLETLAARVTEGDLDARVPNPGPDEIGRLGAQLNRMTESLSVAKRELESNAEQRRRLLADISHELGTPLTSIRGYAETLLDPRVPISDRERLAYHESILGESERINLLIQDLFDLTRLEAGAVDLTRERLDWTALCRNTMQRFLPRFQEAGLSLAWQGPEEAAWVQADGRRLEQVLENLLVNALRYVPRGGSVGLTLEMGAGDPPRHELIVTDDGPGFPPEDLPHVFDRFYRAEGARASQGSGLGLAIVQEIVRRHGGEVRAENRSPAGASIRVLLPA